MSSGEANCGACHSVAECEERGCRVDRAVGPINAGPCPWDSRYTRPTPPPTYPDDNPKSRVGMTKPPLHHIPPSALILLGQAMADGAGKYGTMNWRETRVAATIYYDAIMRHLLAWLDGEDAAQDSGVAHLAHVMACCAIVLDAAAQGRLTDDRPHKGNASALIAALTKKPVSAK